MNLCLSLLLKLRAQHGAVISRRVSFPDTPSVKNFSLRLAQDISELLGRIRHSGQSTVLLYYCYTRGSSCSSGLREELLAASLESLVKAL